MLAALFDALERLHADPKVKAIVVTGSGQNFSAGFDITLFATPGAAGAAGTFFLPKIIFIIEHFFSCLETFLRFSSPCPPGVHTIAVAIC